MNKKLPKKTGKSKTKKPQVARSKSWGSLEKEVLFRPERIGYILGQKGIHPGKKDCVFCQAKGEGVRLESLVLWKGQHTMVVMNKYPYNPGHLLILPLRHEGDLLVLSEQETSELMKMIRHCVAILKKALSPVDLNIGMNLGRGAGAGIPEHLHTHIVPRWPGDTNFFAVIANAKVVPADLGGMYKLLRPQFDALEAL